MTIFFKFCRECGRKVYGAQSEFKYCINCIGKISEKEFKQSLDNNAKKNK
jgi:hypothetical protein